MGIVSRLLHLDASLGWESNGNDETAQSIMIQPRPLDGVFKRVGY